MKDLLLRTVQSGAVVALRTDHCFSGGQVPHGKRAGKGPKSKRTGEGFGKESTGAGILRTNGFPGRGNRIYRSF